RTDRVLFRARGIDARHQARAPEARGVSAPARARARARRAAAARRAARAHLNAAARRIEPVRMSGPRTMGPPAAPKRRSLRRSSFIALLAGALSLVPRAARADDLAAA